MRAGKSRLLPGFVRWHGDCFSIPSTLDPGALMTIRRALPALFSLVCAVLCGSCGGSGDSKTFNVLAAPIGAGTGAFEIAGEVELPAVAPKELPGLHNVFRLSENIVSGAEPQGDAAFAELAGMGVKTILSVDGKVPDAEAAAKHGLRYVHVPIQYSSITADEGARIVKTFRDLEGPFYVHCFHGKHRGPAAGALGRLVLDGASREQAVAEMRQYCGTSGKYAGLYEAVARGEIPDEASTAALVWDFPAAHSFKGVRQAMIRAARVFDNLVALEKRGWLADPEHPDVDAGNEAAKLSDAFGGIVELEEVSSKPEDYRNWLAESVSEAEKLSGALGDLTGGDGTAAERAAGALMIIKNRCSECHSAYRN